MSGLAWVLGKMLDADLRRRVFRWRSQAYWQHSRTNWACLQLLFEKQSSLFLTKPMIDQVYGQWIDISDRLIYTLSSDGLYTNNSVYDERCALWYSIARSAFQLLNTLQTFSDTTSVLKQKSWNSYYNNGIIGLYNIADRTKQGSVFCPSLTERHLSVYNAIQSNAIITYRH